MVSETNHERRTITEILLTERGYLPMGRTEANILSTLVGEKVDILTKSWRKLMILLCR